jgi:hypothetical protein
MFSWGYTGWQVIQSAIQMLRKHAAGRWLPTKGGGALKRNPEYLLVLRVVYNIIVRACIISDLNQFFNTVQTGSLLQLSLGVSTFPSCGPVFCTRLGRSEFIPIVPVFEKTSPPFVLQ